VLCVCSHDYIAEECTLCHSERRTCYVQYHVFVKRSSKLELIQYNKIAVRMSWLFFAESLELLRLTVFLFLAIGERNV